MAKILGTDRIEILKLAAEGATSEAISLGYDYSVYDIRQLLVWDRDPRTRKIGPELAVEIRDRARRESVGAIATSLGVHRNTISRIVNGRGWKT